MSKVNVRHPSVNTILSSIGAAAGLAALFISLSNSATALSGQTLVRKGDIAPGAVTSKTIAPGAIHQKQLAKGAVNAKAIKKGAVTTGKLAQNAVTATVLAEDAVTSRAIAPGSVYGAALGTQTIHTVPIADLDVVPSNPEWTASNTEIASCAPGERLLQGGFAFTNAGNKEVTFLQVSPFISAVSNGVTGRIASNSGGTATAVVHAVCLQ